MSQVILDVPFVNVAVRPPVKAVPIALVSAPFALVDGAIRPSVATVTFLNIADEIPFIVLAVRINLTAESAQFAKLKPALTDGAISLDQLSLAPRHLTITHDLTDVAFAIESLKSCLNQVGVHDLLLVQIVIIVWKFTEYFSYRPSESLYDLFFSLNEIGVHLNLYK